jgi:hypothetical protein
MIRKLNISRTTALAASLALAGASIFGSAASAQHPDFTSSEECYQYVAAGCAANWQRWGYAQYSDCEWGQYCLICLQGYMCGVLSYEVDWAVKPETAAPW